MNRSNIFEFYFHPAHGLCYLDVLGYYRSWLGSQIVLFSEDERGKPKRLAIKMETVPLNRKNDFHASLTVLDETIFFNTFHFEGGGTNRPSVASRRIGNRPSYRSWIGEEVGVVRLCEKLRMGFII